MGTNPCNSIEKVSVLICSQDSTVLVYFGIGKTPIVCTNQSIVSSLSMQEWHEIQYYRTSPSLVIVKSNTAFRYFSVVEISLEECWRRH